MGVDFAFRIAYIIFVPPSYYLMQRLVYIVALLAFQHLSAQTVTGSWYGKADVEMAGMHNNYLMELVIKQKGNRVEGIFGYYFRDKYQSFFVHGRYDPKTRQVVIENIPVIYFNSNSTVNSIDCNTNFIGVIVRSKVQSTLKGAFYHDERYKYMCPDLKVSYTLDREDKKQDSLLATASSGSKVWKPQADDYVVDVVQTDRRANEHSAALSSQKEPVGAVRIDSSIAVSRLPIPAVQKDTVATASLVSPADPDKEDSKKIAESFAKRKAVLNQVLDVESDSVRVSFYDNGEIDGDSISVFVNSQVILTHQELAAKALNVYLRLDSTLNVNEISMFAENLGKYPPNTALMVVTDGKNRYEIFLSSSLTENATIRLKRKRSTVDPHKL